jgi:hypothetical protein
MMSYQINDMIIALLMGEKIKDSVFKVVCYEFGINSEDIDKEDQTSVYDALQYEGLI